MIFILTGIFVAPKQQTALTLSFAKTDLVIYF